MVEMDIVAQWLVGDSLKQNQLNFLYGVQNTLYLTCAKTLMLDDTHNAAILDKTIPELCAFMTMRNILKIQRQKEEDLIKDAERQQRKAVLMAETGMTFDEPVEEVEEEKDDKKKKGKKVKEVEIDPEELERRRQA